MNGIELSVCCASWVPRGGWHCVFYVIVPLFSTRNSTGSDQKKHGKPQRKRQRRQRAATSVCLSRSLAVVLKPKDSRSGPVSAFGLDSPRRFQQRSPDSAHLEGHCTHWGGRESARQGGVRGQEVRGRATASVAVWSQGLRGRGGDGNATA